MCYGVSTLGGRRGQRAEKEGVSGPDGSEEGKCGEVIRTQEIRNPTMIRKKSKRRKCRKNESSKRKMQNRIGNHTNRKKIDQKEGRKQKIE